MSFSPDDISIAIRLLMNTSDATKKVNQMATQLNKLEQAMLRINAIQKARGLGPTFTPEQINSVQKFNAGLNQTASAAHKAGKSIWTLHNFARTALGTLEAMAIFLVTKFIADAIGGAIRGIKQLELAMYNLSVAEKTLSRAGIEITPKDFQDIIKAVEDLGLAISRVDIVKSVSELATGLQDLGLSREQLEGLARAAAIIATAEGLSMENVVDQLTQGIAKGGRGLADLDIQVDAAVIKQRALEEGLVASEEAWNNLTAAQKQSIETQALYLIILDSANTKLEELGMLEKSVTILSKEASANWEDFLAKLGLITSPAIKGGLSFLIWGMEQLLKLAETGRLLYLGFMGVVVGGFIALRGLLKGNVDTLSEFTQLWKQAAQDVWKTLNESMQPPVGEDTPTAPDTSPIVENQEDLQDALEKMNDEILEAQIKLAQDMEEAAIDLGRKLEDIAIEYARKRADAERDYASRVRDINADYREKIADIQSKQAEEAQRARNDELEREAKFQEQMRQLKEEFLMNLEDALHERDARQVLRLIDQYNMQKAQAEREHALEQENAQREQEERQAKFARERADAERERKAKLAEAQRDYQDKLAKLKADEEAERAAAELAYQRKIQDLEREMQDRLEIVAANLVAEFNLTKEGLDAILALYQKYYAEISQIYAAMNTMLQGQQNLGSGNAPKTGSGRGSTVGGHKKFAEGGSMLANQPTTVTFGEGRGWELATFTPLESQGNDINKLFTNLSSGGGAEEKIGLEVVLSPDLEARVVKNAMGQVSNVITTVRRSKR